MRHNFSPTIKKQLCANVGGKCSNPNCRKPTTWPDYTGTKSDSIGEAAHIYAASIEDGPRLKPTMSADEIKHISNGIWLCSNCHTMVDRDVQRFPAELLKKWKQDAEYAQYCEISGFSQPPSFSQNDAKKEHLQALRTSIETLHILLDKALDYYNQNLKRFGITMDTEIAERNLLYRNNLEYIYSEFNEAKQTIGELLSMYSLEYGIELSTLINQYGEAITFKTHSDCFGDTVDYWSGFFNAIDNSHELRRQLFQSVLLVIQQVYLDIDSK
ncbi:HNH endonuclease signature motif containing protein [Ruminococcus flavefaciens]|uniref:HNH endonuclease signature motif containing protein n=1 Tax=Ruminococcus flavefaciens TaxID=1265 RepID=UPI0026EC77AD|nr:HNH endonuclease signature motif containing protein [Ruminococcus flavefaciens]